MELARGANTVVDGTSLKVAVNGSAPGTVDLMVFQLDERNQVRNDADFVFFNQPVSPEGAVRLESGGVIEIDIARLPADIHQLSVAVALDAAANGTLSAVGGLGVVVEQAGSTAIVAQALGLTSERAAVLVEIDPSCRGIAMRRTRSLRSGRVEVAP